MTRVLVVATSRKTRGGITSVLKVYGANTLWQRFNCHWVQTHRDAAAWSKIMYFIFGMIDFLVRVPFYDIVHIHTSDYGAERRKRFFAMLAKFFRKKLVVHFHSSGIESSIGGKHKDLYTYSFTHADKILLLSYTWKNDVKMAFDLPDDKLEVVYNPCQSVEPSALESHEPYVLFAGTLSHRKGYSDLLRAFALVADRFPQWRLKLAGNGEIAHGKRLADDLGINNRVDFLGWINDKDKDDAFRHASIFCLPSYSEGFPMGVLDAWAYALPVITTPVGGIPDVAKDGENMLLFTPGDVEALSEKLEMLMSDASLRNKISNASRELAETTFNMDNISAQLEGIYNNLVGSASLTNKTN